MAARRLLSAVELQRKGRWAQADERLRELLPSQAGNFDYIVQNLVGPWKGYSVAAPSFLRAWSEGGLAAGTYRRFGEDLLQQGYAALAAVELERADMLGDASEELARLLIECYRRSGDPTGLARTLAVAKARHPGAPWPAATAAAAPDAKASLRYHEWIAWSLPLNDAGGISRNAVWTGDAVVYAPASGSGFSRVWSWAPADGSLRWSFDPEADLPEAVRLKPDKQEWMERDVDSIERSGDSVIVRYLEHSMKRNPEGGWGDEGYPSRGSFRLSAASGTVLAHGHPQPAPDAPAAPGCAAVEGLGLPGRCKQAIEDPAGLFVLLEDHRILGLDPASGRTLWEARAGDDTRVPMARAGELLLVGGSDVALAALEAASGRLAWKFPAPTNAPLDVSGPYLIVVAGSQGRVLGLRVPAGLDRVRRGLVEAARAQRGARLAQELWTNILDLDPANEQAYAGLADRLGEHAILALDRESGERLWTAPIESRRVGLTQSLNGRLSVEDGLVVLSAGPEIVALAAGTGEVRWRTSLAADGATFTDAMPPLAAGGTIYASVLYGADRKPREGYFVSLAALAAGDGGLLWRTEVVPDVADGGFQGGPHDLRPVARGGRVYFPTLTGNVYAADAATGKRAWGFAVDRFKADYEDNALSRPVVGPDGLFLLGPTGFLYSIDPATGRLRWKRDLGGEADYDNPTTNTLAEAGGRLCMRRTMANLVLCVDPKTEKPLWTQDDQPYGAAPLLWRGRLWSAEETALLARDPETGAPLERIPLPGVSSIWAVEAEGDDLFVVDSEGVSRVSPAAASEDRLPD